MTGHAQGAAVTAGTAVWHQGDRVRFLTAVHIVQRTDGSWVRSLCGNIYHGSRLTRIAPDTGADCASCAGSASS